MTRHQQRRNRILLCFAGNADDFAVLLLLRSVSEMKMFLFSTLSLFFMSSSSCRNNCEIIFFRKKTGIVQIPTPLMLLTLSRCLPQIDSLYAQSTEGTTKNIILMSAENLFFSLPEYDFDWDQGVFSCFEIFLLVASMFAQKLNRFSQNVSACSLGKNGRISEKAWFNVLLLGYEARNDAETDISCSAFCSLFIANFTLLHMPCADLSALLLWMKKKGG